MNVLHGQTDLVQAERQWVGPLVQAVWCLCALALGVVVWALHRGFNITDEAFYLLNYRYPNEYESSFSTFQLVVTRLLGFTDAPLSTYRALGLAATGVGSGAFSLSLSAWLQALDPVATHRRWVTSPRLVVIYVLLGALLIASIFPVMIFYNGLNTFFMLLASAAVLAALRRGARWAVAAGGWFCGWCLTSLLRLLRRLC